MVRKDNWPVLLSNYLKERMNVPFEWGVNDCMNFTSKAYELLTGNETFSQYAGYTDEDGAKEVLDKHGGVIKIIDKHLGPGHRNTMQAKRGDIVVVKIPEVTAGIIDDTGAKIVVISPQGLIRLPLDRAWRIWSY